jgi:hypothetical protein
MGNKIGFGKRGRLALWLIATVIASGCRPGAEEERETQTVGEERASAAEERGSVETGDPQVVEEPWFVDATQDVGVDFVHFNGMCGRFYICEVKAPGVGILDYDNDGDLDLYLVQATMLDPGMSFEEAIVQPVGPLPPKDRLYRNDLIGPDGKAGRLHFTDVTEEAGLDGRGYGIGVATGDYNNDGWLDLYVSNIGPNNLLRNNGDGTFTDVGEAAGVADSRYCTGAAFLDYDRDGWLDLFVCAYVNFKENTNIECFNPSGQRDYCGPLAYEPLPDKLYRNRGDGTFEDVTGVSRIATEYGSGLGVVAADLNSDGWIDIYVTNDQRENQCWMNMGDGTFSNEALMAGCALDANGDAQASMGVDAGDFDCDGDEDLFMTHLAGETNAIYVNDGTGLFEEMSTATGLAAPSVPYTSFGTGWFDYDNDSWLDIVIANGAVSIVESQAREGDPYPFKQRNQLFRNNRNGGLEEVTDQAGPVFDLMEVSRGLAFGDLDNDGDTDLLITNNTGPARVLINQIGQRAHWLGLRLLGREVERDMFGARIWVHRPGMKPLLRRVHSDASYISANDPRVLVGLGEETDVEKVHVIWPDGYSEVFQDLDVDAYQTLRQGKGEEWNP